MVKWEFQLPGNSITTSHNVGILLSQRRRGDIKWPAYGTRRLICLEAIFKANNNNNNMKGKRNGRKHRKVSEKSMNVTMHITWDIQFELCINLI